MFCRAARFRRPAYSFDNTTPLWQGREGETFRIGYYTPDHGLDVVWLVSASGDYRETIDRETLMKFFEIERVSDETDLFGFDKN